MGLGGPVTQANVSWETGISAPATTREPTRLFNTGGNGDGTCFRSRRAVCWISGFRTPTLTTSVSSLLPTWPKIGSGIPTFYHVVGLADVDSDEYRNGNDLCQRRAPGLNR